MVETHGGNVFAIARQLGRPAEEILDFSASINPLGMPPGVPEALRNCFDSLLHYPDLSCSELRKSLAAYHGLAPEKVAVANGSTELIHLLPRLVGGTSALIVAPAFSEYAAALSRCGWRFEHLTLSATTGFQLCLDSLRAALTKGKHQLAFLCNPGNPTGALIPRATVEEVLQLCQETGTFLVLDEAFMDFCEEESAKALVADLEGGILLRSMTKFFAIPGLRLGYAIATERTLAALAALQAPWSVNTAAQVAGIASLASLNFGEKTRTYLAEERELLQTGLAQLEWVQTFPSQANYLLARLDEGMTAARLRAALLGRGILIRDCSNFHGLDARYFRVAVRSRKENERLLHELRALSRSDLS